MSKEQPKEKQSIGDSNILPKFLRCKALLLSEDAGKTWLVVRQFYLTDARNRFLDEQIQGTRLKSINGDQFNGKTKETDSSPAD